MMSTLQKKIFITKFGDIVMEILIYELSTNKSNKNHENLHFSYIHTETSCDFKLRMQAFVMKFFATTSSKILWVYQKKDNNVYY